MHKISSHQSHLNRPTENEQLFKRLDKNLPKNESVEKCETKYSTHMCFDVFLLGNVYI
jgi:hypothetical protein